jgi:hypothetical protein
MFASVYQAIVFGMAHRLMYLGIIPYETRAARRV